MDCPVVDTYRLLGGDKGEEHYGQYLVDGIHLTREGNSLVYKGSKLSLLVSHFCDKTIRLCVEDPFVVKNALFRGLLLCLCWISRCDRE